MNRPPVAVTAYSHIGNLGCIRFLPAIRKASGVKRGDRLSVVVLGEEAIQLTRLDPHNATASDLSVDACACQTPPGACWMSEGDVLTVGWSYVQLPIEFAIQYGFLPERPIRLVGEIGQITVICLQEFPTKEEVAMVTCPP